MGLFNFKHKSSIYECSSAPRASNPEILNFSNRFFHTMTQIDKLMRVYLGKFPDEYTAIHISVVNSRATYSNGEDAYIEIKILIRSWWDGILGGENEDLEDYMINVFSYNENWFTYKFKVASVQEGRFNRNDLIISKLHTYLIEFQTNNPFLRFRCDDRGATWNS